MQNLYWKLYRSKLNPEFSFGHITLATFNFDIFGEYYKINVCKNESTFVHNPEDISPKDLIF